MGSQSSVGGSAPSNTSSQRLTSMPVPPLYPPSPSPATTRWQGTITGIGFDPMIWPMARAGSGGPSPSDQVRWASVP